jgi:thiosulfate/3-mercaptopyruvate sulfurtransferase
MGKLRLVSNARERVLVDGDWLQARLGQPGLVICEVDERPAIYRIGHVPGAHRLDWRVDLQDPVSRDLPGPEAIRRLWRRLGVTKDSTVVFYGDKSNWYACFGFWLFRLYGAGELRLLDGGRQAWVSEGRPLSEQEPREHDGEPEGSQALAPAPAAARRLRALWRDVEAAMRDGVQLLDVRTPAEYRGDLLSEPGYPEEGAQRAGHIPGALSVPWDIAVAGDGRILDDERLRERFAERGVDLLAPSITYCRIGERSAHTWFVLHELLGSSARNYDGSWTEWGSMIGMPVAIGDDPGRLVARPARAPVRSR